MSRRVIQDTLVIDGRYVHRVDRQPQRLKYWERGEMILRPLRGEVEVGQTWVCPQWLFEKVYEQSQEDRERLLSLSLSQEMK